METLQALLDLFYLNILNTKMADEDRVYDDFIEVTVLAKGNTIHYVVLSFAVLNAELVKVKL